MYRGNELIVEIDATGAVALEDPNIFQSYIICSEYAVDNENVWKTRLTYGKVAAGQKLQMKFITLVSFSQCVTLLLFKLSLDKNSNFFFRCNL